MTRLRRSVYSLVAMNLNTGVILLSGLISTPLLLAFLGDERVGVSRTAIEWLNYLALFSLGVDAILNARFATAVAAHDHNRIVAGLRAGLLTYARFGVLQMLYIGVLIIFAPVLFGLNGETAWLTTELRWSLVLALFAPVTAMLATFRPLIEAEQRGYRAHFANTIGTAVALAASLLFAWLGLGLPGQVVSLMLGPLVLGIIIGSDVIRRYPEALRFRGPIDATDAVFKPVPFTVVLLSRMCFMSDCIIVSLVLGSGSVTAFAVSQRLMILILAIINGLGQSSWPALANVLNKGEYETFHRRMAQLTRLTAALGLALMLPAAVWNQPFLAAWTQKSYLFAGPTMSLLTAIALATYSVVTVWSIPMSVTGRFHQLLPLQLVSAVVSIPTAIYCTHTYGLIGPAIGMLANLVLVTGGWLVRLLQAEFGTPARSLLAAAGGPYLLAVPYYFALDALASSFTVESLTDSRYLRLSIVALLMGTAAVVYLAIAVAFVFPAADRDEFLQRFKIRRRPAA